MQEDPARVIKALRAALDMSQADFARASGWATSTISSWERGRSRPTRLAFKTILAFAEERGVRYRPKTSGTVLLAAPARDADDDAGTHATGHHHHGARDRAHDGEEHRPTWTRPESRLTHRSLAASNERAYWSGDESTRWSAAEPPVWHSGDSGRWSAEARFRVSLGRRPVGARGLRKALQALGVVAAALCIIVLVGMPAPRSQPIPAVQPAPASRLASVPHPPRAPRRPIRPLVAPPVTVRSQLANPRTADRPEPPAAAADRDPATGREIPDTPATSPRQENAADATPNDPMPEDAETAARATAAASAGDAGNGAASGDSGDGASAHDDAGAAPAVARLDSVVRIGDSRRATFRTANDSVTVLEGEWLGSQQVGTIGTDAVTLVGRDGDTRVVRVGQRTTL